MTDTTLTSNDKAYIAAYIALDRGWGAFRSYWHLPLLAFGAATLPAEGVIALIGAVCLLGMYRLTDLPA